MSFPHLIALHGRARTGKDTAGEYLADRYRYALMSFAGPLKAGLAAMIPGWETHLERKEDQIGWLGKSPRQLMQTLGTDWGRDQVHPELWLRIAEQRLRDLRASGLELICFTDCRFENEAQWVRSLGGVVWHLRRDNAPDVQGHASERGVAFGDTDWMILNNDSLDALYSRIDDIIYASAK
jgi:hypothetical protein